MPAVAHTPAARRGVVAFFAQPFDDVMAALEAQIVRAPRPRRAAAVTLLATIVTWWIYVPIHELLHALGCYVTGGRVTELQIAPEYGGALFARFLPFVVAGGNYAGRLSGFDTHGSDLVYLATDALPFALSIGLGVPMLKACARGTRPWLFGASFVLALAPFYSLPGDYYEMGSIVTTRVVTLLQGGGDLAFPTLRADDLVSLVTTLYSNPAALDLHTQGAVAAALIATASLVGLLLACATYALGARLARLL